ncbi:MAG: hypothetical protein MI923_12545 [Phycisphaerales bacterium]|nr:hypothetical protein [Phycisphaerales bacterium]
MQHELTRSQRHRLGLIFIFSCALVAAHVVWLPRIVVDDAFISYRYARNLVDGYGLAFNPGEHVEGYSNFLWVLLTAAGLLWQLEPVSWTRALGVTALMGSVLVAVYLARRLTNSNRAALAVAVILSASTALCGSAMAGLETGLYTLLITAAVTCAARNRPGCASLLIGLGAITRPEGLGVWVIAVFSLVLIRGRHHRWRDVLKLTFPCLLIFTSLVVFRLGYFGHWMPNSVQAKSVMLPLLRKTDLTGWPGLLFNDDGIRYVGDYIRYTFGFWLLIALVPAARSVQHRWIAVFMLGTSAMGVAVAVYNFGDWMTSFRLLTPYLPMTTVLVVWGMSDVLAWLRERGRSGWEAPCRVVFAAAVLYCAAGQFQWRRPVVSRNPDAELAAALNASSEAAGLLAATDVLGRLSYHADQIRVLDMAGLTDEHIARNGRPSPPFGRTDFNYVLSRRPDFIMNNVRTAWARHLDKADFVEGYWWVDCPRWTRPRDAAARPRFVFIRRGSVLETEFRARFPSATFRLPCEIIE